MRAYRVLGVEDTLYSGTLTGAHKQAKQFVTDGDDWRDIKVIEIDVRNDKDAFICALNGYPVSKDTGRVWGFKSARLGLEEVGGEE